MMVKHTIIDTLIELTAQASDMAAVQLGHAVRAHEESREKSDLLVSYRQEYIEKLRATMAVGLSIQQHKNYQDFINGLDRAIAQQNQTCAMTHEKVCAQRIMWQQSERRHLSYTTLSQRATALALKVENKRDQKNTDEFAARKRNEQR
jgi:flagellar FliJ protein